MLARARRAYRKGDYRWVVEVVNHVIFANPGSAQARMLQADALEHLGYQCENPTWRNEYLMGAFELRHGTLMGERTRSSPEHEVVSCTQSPRPAPI